MTGRAEDSTVPVFRHPILSQSAVKIRPRTLFPILEWLPRYRLADLRGDAVAGITVGIMLIPQGMAYAILAGMPPIYGLYASVVPLLVYAIFGSSRHLSVGNTAIDSMIMVVGLGALAEIGSDDYVGVALAFAVLVGLIHLALGAMRLGFLVNLLSRPVIVGFTSAAAIIIGFSQLSNLLGVSLPRTEQVVLVLIAAARQIGSMHLPTVGIGIGAIVLLVLLRRWKPLFPGALTVVSIGTWAVWQFDLAGTGLKIVGEVPSGLPGPRVPHVDWVELGALLPTAITLALIQFTNVVSLGKVFAARHRYSIAPNRELVSIGLANVLGGIFQSFSISGSFSRTAVNEQAGARTALANAFAAVLIVLTLLVLTPLFYFLPIPVLAGIIMVAAFGMIEVKAFRYLYKMKRVDGGIALLTFVLTLATGLQIGILVGIAVSIIAILYRISRPNVAILGHLPGTRSFRDVERNPEAKPIDGILLLRVDASFSYANAEYLKDLILEQVAPQAGREGVRAVVIDASTVNDVDTTAIDALQLIAETLRDRSIALYLSGIHGNVRGMMERSGFYALLGIDHFFLSPHRAVKQILADWGRSEDYRAEEG